MLFCLFGMFVYAPIKQPFNWCRALACGGSNLHRQKARAEVRTTEGRVASGGERVAVVVNEWWQWWMVVNVVIWWWWWVGGECEDWGDCGECGALDSDELVTQVSWQSRTNREGMSAAPSCTPEGRQVGGMMVYVVQWVSLTRSEVCDYNGGSFWQQFQQTSNEFDNWIEIQHCSILLNSNWRPFVVVTPSL